MVGADGRDHMGCMRAPQPLTRCQLDPGWPPLCAAPLTLHTAAWPLSFCHSRSDVPSLLKSEAALREVTAKE